MEELIKKKIRDVPDFPKKGIIFKDITPVLSDSKVFRLVIDELVKRYSSRKIDAVIAIESRGFLFGAPLAYRLGLPCIPVRKKGKLPYKTVEMSYDLEYGSATIEMHIDAIAKGQRVIIIDDLLATGGTAAATCELVKKQGGLVDECAFLVELSFLNGREKLKQEIYSMVKY
jgi:adenine phosphoribosyltransferase